MDLGVGGFLRLLQVAQLLKFWGNIHVCVKSEEIWEIEKRRSKKAMLDTFIQIFALWFDDISYTCTHTE